MKKIDYKKELKHLYKPSAKTVEIVDVPKMNFLMIDGQGDPNTSQEYSDAIEALYAASYALKFMIKKGELEIDYGVMPLEGLWWVDDMSEFDINDMTKDMGYAVAGYDDFPQKFNRTSSIEFENKT